MSDLPPSPSTHLAAASLPQYPWWVLPGLAAMVIGIFGGALAATCFMANDTLRTQMFTAAAVGFSSALGYFFGSSAGSQKKDDLTAASMLKKDDTIATNTVALASSAPVPQDRK